MRFNYLDLTLLAGGIVFFLFWRLGSRRGRKKLLSEKTADSVSVEKGGSLIKMEDLNKNQISSEVNKCLKGSLSDLAVFLKTNSATDRFVQYLRHNFTNPKDIKVIEGFQKKIEALTKLIEAGKKFDIETADIENLEEEKKLRKLNLVAEMAKKEAEIREYKGENKKTVEEKLAKAKALREQQMRDVYDTAKLQAELEKKIIEELPEEMAEKVLEYAEQMLLDKKTSNL